MAYVKYTRQMLSEAVAASISMAGVLRHLGLPQNGGAHAHLRRRINQLRIDTSHFLGQAHLRGTPNPRRRHHTEVLVLRPMDAKREKPTALRRALEETGRSYLCAECGIGDSWNGRPLTLHVDHIDGQFWDCRIDNLRFLCPNCHGQTATYAGRKSKQNPAALVQVDDDGNPVTDAPRHTPLSEVDVLRLLARVGQKSIGPSEAARLIGCSREQVYKLQKRLAERGSIATAARQPRLSEASRSAVLAFSLAHPDLGPRKIAAALRNPPASLTISPSTVSNLLASAGLGTREKRVAAAKEV